MVDRTVRVRASLTTPVARRAWILGAAEPERPDMGRPAARADQRGEAGGDRQAHQVRTRCGTASSPPPSTPGFRSETCKKPRRTRARGRQCATTEDADHSTATPPTSSQPSSPAPADSPPGERPLSTAGHTSHRALSDARRRHPPARSTCSTRSSCRIARSLTRCGAVSF